MGTPGVPGQQPRHAVDRTISVTCQDHGRCNLRVTRRPDGGIVLNPHAGALCVLTLHEVGGAELRDALIEWLGSKGTR